MPRKIVQSKVKTHGTAAARARTGSRARSAPPTISGRWILGALAGVVAVAALCVWLVLCLLFWQGSWQLLYHPSATVAKTPSSASLAFDPIDFATTGAGVPQLSGWWIPAASDSRYSRYTVLYLHRQDGNLGDTIPALAQLHETGVNVFAFDYQRLRAEQVCSSQRNKLARRRWLGARLPHQHAPHRSAHDRGLRLEPWRRPRA